MQRRQLRTAGEVLKTVPGISVQQSGGPGTQTSVFVRGSNSNHVLVLIDGVTVNDPSTPNGAPDFAHFLTENLDRIEIVRGPMSTMYGSQAIGGVINMVTKAGKGPMNGAAFTELGTRMWSNSGAYVRGSEGRFNYNITFAGTFTPNDTPVPARFTPNGGYVDIDPYRNITVAARLGFEINDNTQFNWYGRYIDTKLNYDQVGQEDPNANGYTSQFYTRGEIEGSYFNGRWKPVIGVNYSTITRHDLDYASPQVPFPFSVDSLFNGRRLQGDFKNLVTIIDEVEVIAGLDYDRQWAYSNTLELSSARDARGPGLGHDGADRSLRPAPAQSVHRLQPQCRRARRLQRHLRQRRHVACRCVLPVGADRHQGQGVLRHRLQGAVAVRALWHRPLLRRQPQHPARVQPRLRGRCRAGHVRPQGQDGHHLLLQHLLEPDPVPAALHQRCRTSPTRRARASRPSCRSAR